MVGVDLCRDVVETVLMDLVEQDFNTERVVSLLAYLEKCRKEGQKPRNELTRHTQISFKKNIRF